MSDRRIHRLYRHFQELPLSMRVLFTGTLLAIGMGYMFALIYVYATDAGRDGNPALTVEDIIDIDGPRIPDAAASPNLFRAATIVVSRERLLSLRSEVGSNSTTPTLTESL